MTAAKLLCLTPRQAAVLELVHDDLGDKAIADRLGCSPFTVRAHLRTIFARLGVHGRAGAAVAWEKAQASHKSTSRKVRGDRTGQSMGK